MQPPARYKIVVVDATSVKLLSAACKMYDILEENVTCKSRLPDAPETDAYA